MKNFKEITYTMEHVEPKKDYGEWGTINKEWLALAKEMTTNEIIEEVLREAEDNCLYPDELAFTQLVAYHLDIDFEGVPITVYWETEGDYNYGCPKFKLA